MKHVHTGGYRSSTSEVSKIVPSDRSRFWELYIPTSQFRVKAVDL
jgi:hypothetical protein